MNNQEMRNQIRQIIQEEMASSSSRDESNRQCTSLPRPVNQLISRTRALIQNSASSAIEQLQNHSPVTTPNHPNRISFANSRAKKRKQQAEVYAHEVQVLHLISRSNLDTYEENSPFPDYYLTMECICV